MHTTSAVQSKNTVSAYFRSKQILGQRFVFDGMNSTFLIGLIRFTEKLECVGGAQ